jgi:hypothetical protein
MTSLSDAPGWVLTTTPSPQRTSGRRRAVPQGRSCPLGTLMRLTSRRF